MNGTQPLEVILEAIKAVPAVKYALGVAGIVAVVALVQAFKLDLKVAAFGTIVIFAFMVLLVIFARLTTTAPSHFLLPVLVTMWAFLALVIASATLLFSTVFFATPRTFYAWLFKKKEAEPVADSSDGVSPELIRTAEMQSRSGDYPAAWRQIEEVLKEHPNSQDVLKVQAQIAMDWLRNIRILRMPGKKEETFSEIVDLVSPCLYRSATTAKGAWAADIHAHLGWGNYLKYREAVRGLDIEEHFKEALRLDEGNVFAHVMWGFWILWHDSDLQKANEHFAAAARSGRERDYVNELHAAALLNNSSTKEVRLEMIRFANQRRMNQQPLDEDQRHRILSYVYVGDWKEVNQNLQSANPVLPPAQHLATLNWLSEGLELWQRERFCVARLTEATGDSFGALLLYGPLMRGGYLLDGDLQEEIERGIARCAKASPNTIPRLLDHLKQSDSQGRAMAIDCLAELQPDPDLVIGALTNALTDKDARVRERAVRALASFARDDNAIVGTLLQLIDDEAEEVRLAVCEEAGRIGRPAVPTLIALIKTDNPRTRKSASAVLERIGSDAIEAVPQLVEALKDKNDKIIRAASSVLSAIGPGAVAAVPVLIELASGSNEELRGSAAYTLGAIGPNAKDAVPILTKMLKAREGEPGYRGCTAAEALGKIGPAAKEAVPALAEALHEYQEVRLPVYAAEALGRIGAEAKTAIPALIEAMKDAEKDHKRNQAEPLTLIAGALGAQGGAQAMPFLREILRAFEQENFEPSVLGPVRDALEFLREGKEPGK